MTDPLADRIAGRLAGSSDIAVITVLRRKAAPLVLTGRDLSARAAAAQARWRAQLGDGPLRLVLALPPGELFLDSLLAGMMGGHTVVPVALPRQGSVSSRLAHIARDCQAHAVLCSAAQAAAIRDGLAPGGQALPCAVLAMDGPEEDALIPAERARPLGLDPRTPGGPQPALIQYTSGSTRLPKGVLLPGAQILANRQIVEDSWDMNPTSCVVNWLPHYHDMGLMGGILYPLLSGGHSVQMSPLDMVRRPADWLRAISDYRGTFSGGPAFAYADCLRRVTDADCEGLDLSSWSRAYCGAEPIPADLLDAFAQRFGAYGLQRQALFGCYGMAEITLFAAGAPEPQVLPPPPPGCEAVHPCRLSDLTAPLLRIVDPDTHQPLPDGEQGEIWLGGPSKAEGYVNLPDETAESFSARIAGEDGLWLRTGDLGLVQDGFLYVTGRIKDMLIANGRKIGAAELEWLAAGADPALNPLAAAAFAPDPAQGAEAVLMIELKAGHQAPEAPEQTVRQRIERLVTGEWGITLRDLHILPRGRLARTSSGKVRRQVIAQAYRQGATPGGTLAEATED